jgi:hypothetical protein
MDRTTPLPQVTRTVQTGILTAQVSLHLLSRIHKAIRGVTAIQHRVEILTQIILFELTMEISVILVILFNLDSNFFEIINNITGNLNMNIQFNNSDPRNNMRFMQNQMRNNINPHNYQDDHFTSESDENSVVSLNLENGEEEAPEQPEYDEESYRQLMMQKRGEIIEELNVFQFKHANKFVGRVEE